MQKLREFIENELRNANFQMQLNNLTDDIISLKISRSGITTVLNVERHRHRPFEVEVTADYSIAKLQDIIRLKKKNTNPRQGGMGQYRSLWLFFIFFGVIVSIISSITGGFLILLDKITPGWTRGQQAVGLIFVVLFLPLLWIYLKPLLEGLRRSRKNKVDAEILEIICNRLIKLNQELSETKIIRCWNCFKEVEIEEEYCSQCGEKQK